MFPEWLKRHAARGECGEEGLWAQDGLWAQEGLWAGLWAQRRPCLHEVRLWARSERRLGARRARPLVIHLNHHPHVQRPARRHLQLAEEPHAERRRAAALLRRARL